MRIDIPASITMEIATRTNRYRWKSKNKISLYQTKQRRITLRISCAKFGKNTRDIEKSKRQISIEFIKEDSKWIAVMNRSKNYNITLTSNIKDKNNPHQAVEMVINKIIPSEIEKEMSREIYKNKKTTATKQINVRLNMEEWKDFDLKPWDFLYQSEIHAKDLMRYALENGFNVSFVPKGREFDLVLIRKDGKKFIIGILSHVAKTASRSKEHRINKALLDIAKMLPTLFIEKTAIPVIITQPFEFEGSWSFTTTKYINFYKKQFNFNFIFTDFDSNWMEEICQRLSYI